MSEAYKRNIKRVYGREVPEIRDDDDVILLGDVRRAFSARVSASGGLLDITNIMMMPTNINLQSVTLDIIGKGAGSSKTTTAIHGITLAEEFGVGDELYLHWVEPANLDKVINPSLLIAAFPVASESGRTVSFDLDMGEQFVGSDVTQSIVTVSEVDVPVPETANENFPIVCPISATGLFGNGSAIYFRIRRVASSNDPMDVAVHHVQLNYGIIVS